MSDYAEATADYDVDRALRRAYAQQEAPVYLPAPLPAPVVHQPVPLPAPSPRVDVPSLRLASAGVCALGTGGGVYLGGLGVHEAGPYLPWLAGALAAAAALVAMLKPRAAPASTGTTVNIHGGRNKFRDIR